MSLPDALLEGVRLFNLGHYFEAHEAMEEAWRAEPEPGRRRFFHGLTQVAVGFTHLQRRNRHGARALLLAGIEKLHPFGDAAFGLRLEALRTATGSVLARLEAGEWPEEEPAASGARIELHVLS